MNGMAAKRIRESRTPVALKTNSPKALLEKIHGLVLQDANVLSSLSALVSPANLQLMSAGGVGGESLSRHILEVLALGIQRQSELEDEIAETFAVGILDSLLVSTAMKTLKSVKSVQNPPAKWKQRVLGSIRSALAPVEARGGKNGILAGKIRKECWR